MNCFNARLWLSKVLVFFTFNLLAQADDASLYQTVKTSVNLVLPGDHPDPTLLKVGSDYYHCGSSFHFTPYLPIYHSKDLVHWKEICRVVYPDNGSFVSDAPSRGIWQGAITYFYNSYWIYFSAAGNQWYCKAASAAGPWSSPVKVDKTASSGDLGYDNSIFVDDDGRPYMLIKNGRSINRINEIGLDGQLTGSVLNLDWVNANYQYSWAEGPVMFKRNGFYYYTIAKNVGGGQVVLRGTELSADSTKWERLGDFYKPITDQVTGFRRPNHTSAPVQLTDGTWWAITHSYEKNLGDDWSGQGRQSLLYQIIWEGDRPWGLPPSSVPFKKPDLPKSGVSWRTSSSDNFAGSSLNIAWHFLSKTAAGKYSLTANPGSLRLNPGIDESAHLLQKEGGHYYNILCKVSIDAKSLNDQAGLYLCNGNESVSVKLCSGFADGKKIMFSMGTLQYKVDNTYGNNVWLKLERNYHVLSAFVSKDGVSWIQVGSNISSVELDKEQPQYNSWVGNSHGLYAAGTTADFDSFVYKDGLSELPIVGYSNFYGVETLLKDSRKVATNTSNNGGWIMIAGADLTGRDTFVNQVEVTASSLRSDKLEIWLDDIENGGKLISTLQINNTGAENKFMKFAASIEPIAGQHDIYLRFPGTKNAFYLNSIRFNHLTSASSMKIYSFENDAATTAASSPPATNVTIATGNTATMGVVNYTSSNGQTSKALRAYTGGNRNITGVANLNLFPAAADYSVTWKQTNGSGSIDYKAGYLLRGNGAAGTATSGYTYGMLSGYYFMVYNVNSARTEFRIYRSTSATSLTTLVNTFVPGLVPAAGQAVWYRASATGSSSVSLKLEYSTDSLNWNNGAVVTDASASPFTSGVTQLVWGLGAPGYNFHMDNITFRENATVLPVQMASFSAITETGKVRLDWNTFSETNNAVFDIERSVNGRPFEKIGFVTGSGISNTMNWYRHFDTNPQPGINYYRLKQIDANGEFSYSPTKAVNYGLSNSSVQIYPNPVTDILNIINGGAGSIIIINGSGQVVLRTAVSASGKTQIDVSHLASGVYFYRLNSFRGTFIKKD